MPPSPIGSSELVRADDRAEAFLRRPPDRTRPVTSPPAIRGTGSTLGSAASRFVDTTAQVGAPTAGLVQVRLRSAGSCRSDAAKKRSSISGDGMLMSGTWRNGSPDTARPDHGTRPGETARDSRRGCCLDDRRDGAEASCRGVVHVRCGPTFGGQPRSGCRRGKLPDDSALTLPYERIGTVGSQSVDFQEPGRLAFFPGECQCQVRPLAFRVGLALVGELVRASSSGARPRDLQRDRGSGRGGNGDGVR